MTDLSSPPLSLTPLEPEAPAEDGAHAVKLRHAGFCWPTPPFAGYPQATEQTRAEPCVIAGMNGKLDLLIQLIQKPNK